LLVFQKGECIYDITYYFAHHYFVERKDRTIDQVVQAARSGKQNIAEGCAAGTTSSETELRLLGVARASMKEVLEDYKDYLRTRGLTKWHVNDPRTQKTKAFCRKHYNPADYTKDIERRSPEALCNIAITLIHQYDVMMGRLLDRLQKDFVEEGGIREQMTAARLGYRNNQKNRIAQLEAENNSLKARIAELEAKLSSLPGLIALIFVLASCSTDSEPGAENEEPNATLPQTAIAFGSEIDEGQTVTRATSLKDKTTTFTVYGFKNTEYDDGSSAYTAYQTVFPGYTVNWKANTAGTSTTNTHDWEYIGQQDEGQTVQTIKFWDWGAKAYRFCGVTDKDATGSVVTIDGNDACQLTFSVDATNPSTAPYYSHLWFSDGSDPQKPFGKNVQLEFLQPLSRVKYLFTFEDPVDEGITTLSRMNFHPIDGGDIKQSGTVTLLYPLTGTLTTETITVTTDGDEGLSVSGLDEANTVFTVLPVSGQGPYELTVYVDGVEKNAVVPAAFMDWKAGYEYTYIFKVHVDKSVTIEAVNSAFTPWEEQEDNHTVYNW
jgi:four helix bundle suffix protein